MYFNPDFDLVQNSSTGFGLSIYDVKAQNGVLDIIRNHPRFDPSRLERQKTFAPKMFTKSVEDYDPECDMEEILTALEFVDANIFSKVREAG
jgi:hypothetical protein